MKIHAVFCVIVALLAASPVSGLVAEAFAWSNGFQDGHCVATFVGSHSVTMSDIDPSDHGEELDLEGNLVRCDLSVSITAPCLKESFIGVKNALLCDTEAQTNCNGASAPVGALSEGGARCPSACDSAAGPCSSVTCSSGPPVP